MSVANVEAVLGRVDFVDYQAGLFAYSRYHETLAQLGAHYGQPVEVAVAVFSALSPTNGYEGNLRSAATVLKAVAEGWSVDEVTVSTYRAALARAWRFAHGEDFLATTKGLRTRAFYVNLLDPADCSRVTVDGHMVGVWLGRRILMRDVASMLTARMYREIESGFKEVAERQRLVPSQLQAMLWFTWKRLHEVLAPKQLEVTGDHCDLVRRPDQIPTFPRRVNGARSSLVTTEPPTPTSQLELMQ